MFFVFLLSLIDWCSTNMSLKIEVEEIIKISINTKNEEFSSTWCVLLIVMIFILNYSYKFINEKIDLHFPKSATTPVHGLDLNPCTSTINVLLPEIVVLLSSIKW